MKKSMILLAFMLMLGVTSAHAQFEQNKWFINPSVTGLNLSYSDATDTQFGISAQIGAFVLDNFALLVNLKADFNSVYDNVGLGVGGRYYFDTTGIYLGAAAGLDHFSKPMKETMFSLDAEVGYAFFITRTVTLEPAVYYTWNTKYSELSTFGLKLGFGIYF